MRKRLLAALPAMVLATSGAWAADVMKVSLDHARILRLSQDAGHVIVGNPEIVDVTVESPRLVVLFGKRVGETTHAVLDPENGSVLETAVVVAPGNARTVTVTSPQKGAAPVETEYSCAPRCSRIERKAAPAPSPASQTDGPQ